LSEILSSAKTGDDLKKTLLPHFSKPEVLDSNNNNNNGLFVLAAESWISTIYNK